MAEPWQRTDFSKKGGGNQRADERTERALEKLKRADRRRAAGWEPIDETKIEKGTMRRIGKVDNATGGVIKTGWRGKIDVNRKKPGEPIPPKGEIQITKGGKTVAVDPPKKAPSSPSQDFLRRDPRVSDADIQQQKDLQTGRKAAKKVVDTAKKVIKDKGVGGVLKAGLVGAIIDSLISGGDFGGGPRVTLSNPTGRDLGNRYGEDEIMKKKKIPKQVPKELSPKKGRRSGPCPSMTRKGKTLYARDGSRCGRRAATVRGPTRGYD